MKLGRTLVQETFSSSVEVVIRGHGGRVNLETIEKRMLVPPLTGE